MAGQVPSAALCTQLRKKILKRIDVLKFKNIEAAGARWARAGFARRTRHLHGETLGSHARQRCIIVYAVCPGPYECLILMQGTQDGRAILPHTSSSNL